MITLQKLFETWWDNIRNRGLRWFERNGYVCPSCTALGCTVFLLSVSTDLTWIWSVSRMFGSLGLVGNLMAQGIKVFRTVFWVLNSTYVLFKKGATNLGKTRVTFDTYNTGPNHDFYTLWHFNYLSSNQTSTQCFLPKGNSSSWQVPFPFTYYHPSLWKPYNYLWHLLLPHFENQFLANICSFSLCHVSSISSSLLAFGASTQRRTLSYLAWPTLIHLIYLLTIA